MENGDQSWCALAAAVTADPNVVTGKDPGECHLLVTKWVWDLESPAVLLIDDYGKVSTPQLDLALAEAVAVTPRLQTVVASRAFSVMTGPVVASRFHTLVLTEKELRARIPPLPPKASLAVLRKRGEDLRELLTISSPLVGEVMTVSWLLGPLPKRAIARILGKRPREIRAVLTQLEQAGLVRREQAQGSTVYAVLPELGPVLEANSALLESMNADTLRRRYAIALASEEPLTALRVLIQLRDLHNADQIARTYFADLLRNAKPLAKLLDSLGLSTLRRFPVTLALFLAASVGAKSTTIEEAVVLAVDLRERLTAELEGYGAATMGSDSSSRMPVDLHTMLMAADRLLGNWDSALASAIYLESRLAEEDRRVGMAGRSGYGPDERNLPLIYLQISLTGFLAGDSTLAERASCTLTHGS